MHGAFATERREIEPNLPNINQRHHREYKLRILILGYKGPTGKPLEHILQQRRLLHLNLQIDRLTLISRLPPDRHQKITDNLPILLGTLIGIITKPIELHAPALVVPALHQIHLFQLLLVGALARETRVWVVDLLGLD